MTRKEIHKEIRKISRSENKCECYLCKSKKHIQNHHIIKVEVLGDMAYLNGYNTKEQIAELYIPTVDLCEECHKTVHSLMMDNYIEPTIEYKDFLGVMCILDMINLEEAPDDLLEEYTKATNTLMETVIFNLLEFGEFTEEELETIDLIIAEMEGGIEDDFIRSN